MVCSLLSISLSHRSCHKDEVKGWIFIKTSVHGVQNYQALLLIKHLLLHDQHLHSMWYLCGSESNKMKYIYCLTIFPDMSARPSLQVISVARNPTKCNIFIAWQYFLTCLQDPLYKWILTLLAFNGLQYRHAIRKYYKLFLVETFTCVKALLIASTSAVKILQPFLSR